MKKYIGIAIVILLGCIPLFDLLHNGLPQTHDGMDHVARIANFYKSLSEGVIIPRWAENLNWGYGHPILMFLYPLSSYIASFFHFLSFSYIDSVKLVFGLGFIASGITMYLWAREQFNEHFGIAASLLYLYTPYRFVDMYVRGAIGEHMAFIFPPLIMYFLLLYFRTNQTKKEYWYFAGISISTALLLLAHNAISIMFLPLIIIYAVYLSYINKQYKKLFLSGASLVWGLLLSGFFTFPAFFEGKFTLRDIVTGNEYKDRFVNLLSLIYSPWNYGISGQFSVQIGIANIAGLLLLPFIFIKKIRKEEKILFIIFFVFFLLSIFVMLPQSNFLYNTITTLKKFQFPWRFLSLTAFTTSVMGASIFLVIKKESYKKIGIAVLIISLFLTTSSFWKAKSFIVKPDSFYNAIYYGTTDTGESAPVWSIRFMEKEPKAHLEVISGEANYLEVKRTSTKHNYQISVQSDTARIKDNTLFFPNWTVFANGRKQDIQFQDPSQRGLITFTLPKGEYKVDVVFNDTKLRIISNMVSLLALLLIPVLLIVNNYKHEK